MPSADVAVLRFARQIQGCSRRQGINELLLPSGVYPACAGWLQIIILAGGTNDFHNTTLSEDHHVDDPALPPVHEWVDMYLDYVEQVRKLAT